jgi:hypothetical protein
MGAWMRSVRTGVAVAVYVALTSCGGSNNFNPPPPPPPPTGNNVASVVVNSGPMSQNINTLFVSVTVCVPGSTTSCQTIDNVQVDTGSVGLRILSSALTLNLPVATLPSGNALAECDIFGVGFSWGPVVMADMTIVGETAKSLPMQVIGDPRFPNVPADCSGMGGQEQDTVADFGANGLLGVGPFTQDQPAAAAMVIPGTYYACPPAGGACTGSMAPLSAQVVNPVALFPKDNNGVIIALPSVPAGGAQTVSGTLTFGIDTESNNASGSQTVLTVNEEEELTMTYNGVALPQSFIDSGSNGIFFNDGNIAQCNMLANFYCPGNILSLTVSITGQNGIMANNLPFNVGNAQTIPLNLAAFPPLAGTNPISPQSFDWGLAFFYNRRVAVAIEGNTTTVGSGPYIAF